MSSGFASRGTHNEARPCGGPRRIDDQTSLLYGPQDAPCPAIGLDGKPEGPPFVAADRVQAGVGDMVLLLQEGSSARSIFDDPEAPVRSVIVGIVDRVDLG